MKTNLFTLLCAALISSSCQPDNLPKVDNTKQVESPSIDPNNFPVYKFDVENPVSYNSKIFVIKVDGKEYILAQGYRCISLCPK